MRKPSLKLKRPLKLNNKGQGLIEYLILVALIAISTIGVIKVVGQNLTAQYENINRALGAKNSKQLTIQNAPDAAMKQKDLSNFIEGSRLSK